MTKESLLNEKNRSQRRGEITPELDEILEEIMELKGKLDHKIFIESKELLNDELLMMSMKIDKVIIKYLKTKQKLHSEKKVIP